MGNDYVQTPSTRAVFGRRIDLDPFLVAPIGEERNGTPLSVLSALARLDKDPWQEAATLTAMTIQDATLRLTSLLSNAANPPEPAEIARVVALLPRTPPLERQPREIAWDDPKASPWIVAIYIVMALITICTEQFAEGRGAPASPEGGAAAHLEDAHASPKADFESDRGPVKFRSFSNWPNRLRTT